MSKLDLSQYSDRDIVIAFFSLPVRKFISVTNALTAMGKQMEKKGNKIAHDENDVVEDMIRQMFEENND